MFSVPLVVFYKVKEVLRALTLVMNVYLRSADTPELWTLVSSKVHMGLCHGVTVFCYGDMTEGQST